MIYSPVVKVFWWERAKHNSWPPFCGIFGLRKVFVFLCEVLVWSTAIYKPFQTSDRRVSCGSKSHSRLTGICSCILSLWKIKYSDLVWFKESEEFLLKTLLYEKFLPLSTKTVSWQWSHLHFLHQPSSGITPFKKEKKTGERMTYTAYITG